MQNQSTYTVNVDDIGTFEFSRRKMRTEMRIGAEFSRLTEGEEYLAPWFKDVATVISSLKVLTVSAPKGWDIDEMDPLDGDAYKRIMQVYTAMRAKEDSFRNRPSGAEATSEGARQDDRVVVPDSV